MPFGDYSNLLEDFTGANENPLSLGGTWAKLNSADAQDIQLTSNAATGTGASTGHRYWTVNNFGPDVEIYCTMATKPGDGSNCALIARIQGEGGSNTWDGYVLSILPAAGTDQWALVRTDNAAFTTLAIASREFLSGEKIGMTIYGPYLTAYVYPIGGPWTLLGQATDYTYPSAGKIAIRGHQTVFRLDDLYVGTVNQPGGAVPANELGKGSAW